MNVFDQFPQEWFDKQIFSAVQDVAVVIVVVFIAHISFVGLLTYQLIEQFNKRFERIAQALEKLDPKKETSE